ncbi:hypothetical protein PVAND_008696 [Polypedilum vanderplanki]|uniref:CCHC-type domain-containing protein n=1 Tax=Polypedilum vanderplanki TaxID=319348 RepID=A0A9J6CAS5_POLVA|nr:hypothetical protein PVAND_008696 [Polypedilum vanderplanki]
MKLSCIILFYWLAILNSSLALHSVTIECKYYLEVDFGYECIVDNQEVFTGNRVIIENAIGQHEDGRTNDDVERFYITNATNLKYFPKNINNIFKKGLTKIAIQNSNLIEITSEDLKVYPKLKFLLLNGNQLKVIREDTFKFNPALEWIVMFSNKIKHIDPKSFSALKNLEILDMRANYCNFESADYKDAVLEMVKKIEKGACQSNKYKTTTTMNPLITINEKLEGNDLQENIAEVDEYRDYLDDYYENSNNLKNSQVENDKAEESNSDFDSISLKSISQSDANIQSNQGKSIKVKPIIVDSSLLAVRNLPNNLQLKSKPLLKLADKRIQINCSSIEDKITIMNKLKSQQYKYFSFTESSDKSKIVLLKGFYLDSNFDIKSQTESLKNILSQSDLKVGNREKLPVQCFNCQQWGHSSVNCGFPSRCVNSDENHPVGQCRRVNKEIGSPKCVNCKGEHPANYKRCPIFLNHQKKIDDMKKKSTKINTKFAAQHRIRSSQQIFNDEDFPPLINLSSPVINNVQVSSNHSQSRSDPLLKNFHEACEEFKNLPSIRNSMAIFIDFVGKLKLAKSEAERQMCLATHLFDFNYET